MPQTYTLTKDNYLYSFIDINTYDSDRSDPPLKLAITAAGKTIAMFRSDNPVIINSDDTLMVHGTKISEPDRQKLAKLFYFTGKTLIYKPGWANGSGYFFFGVNCNGGSILCVPQARETPTLVTTFKNLPFIFDWSKYGVKVPDSPLTASQSKVDALKLELQQKEERIKELEQQPARGDQPAATDDAKIKELKDEQSKLKQELDERNEKLAKKESKIKELAEQISAMTQQEAEKNNNMEKLNQELSTLKVQIDKNNEQLNEKERRIIELREKQSELERKLREKDQLLENKSKELEENESKFKKEIEEKESKIKELEEQISTMTQEEADNNNNMEKLNQELSTLKVQMDKNNEELNEKERRIDELREKQSELERKLREKDQLLENKNKELEENELKFKKEIEEKESKIKSVGEEQSILMQQQEEKNRMENEIARLNQELSTLKEQIGKKDREMKEKEAEIIELKGKQSELERILQLETQLVIDSAQERQTQQTNQEMKKDKEEEIEKLKKQQSILEQEIEKKNTKITELEKQLQQNEEKVTKSDFQLVTNKLDQLLTTFTIGHLPQTLLQPLPEVVKSRCSQLIADKFSISSENLSKFTKRPQFRVSMKNLRVFSPVDENVEGKFPKEEICVYTSDGRFNKNGWWFLKVAEHSNITMLAFYDGDMDQVSVHGNYVRIPFRPETSFSSNTQFFVGLIRGIGLRFMFLYELI